MSEIDVTEVFRRAHQGLPREAPGSRGTTELLLRLAGDLPGEPDVLDLGCGTGPAAVPLAELTGGRVTGVDLHAGFLDDLRRRAEAAGVGDRVTALPASIDDLPLPDACADLVWAEGSAYVVGFDAALTGWRRLLRPGGVLVLTEAEWLVPDPSPGARAFWDPGYPAMRTTAGNIAAAERLGWTVRATYVLPDSDWAEYYDPLRARLEELRAAGVPDGLVDQVGEEIGVREWHGAEYGYTGYVLRPR
ncbi:class I SAM-dependent methyltransferase [Nocardioides litoris]|uniref:class I SAM-dependent methyltransferase n=1 Tax=Nocardioides litoris TaxID=1926648 RepID=UPI001B87FA6C|nr:class I SAM-dependent methyltransferase [Nocardioides litoris]